MLIPKQQQQSLLHVNQERRFTSMSFMISCYKYKVLPVTTGASTGARLNLCSYAEQNISSKKGLCVEQDKAMVRCRVHSRAFDGDRVMDIDGFFATEAVGLAPISFGRGGGLLIPPRKAPPSKGTPPLVTGWGGMGSNRYTTKK